MVKKVVKECKNSANDWCFFWAVAGFLVGVFVSWGLFFGLGSGVG